MNSFYIPALAGQIYAMPGMETKLHGVMNKAGNYEGFSANYSGSGFSGMKFRFHGMSDADYAAWLAKVKASSDTLSRETYLKLEKPSEREPVRYYASVEPNLYHDILNLCADGKKMCMDKMMAIDMGMAPREKPQMTEPHKAMGESALVAEPATTPAEPTEHHHH